MNKIIIIGIILIFSFLAFPLLQDIPPGGHVCYAQSKKQASPGKTTQGTDQWPHLSKAVICPALKDKHPVDPGIVFSVKQENILCFNEFDSVSRTCYIFHRWFHRDKLISSIKLRLKPPRWSTFSRIQPRKEDKGPWRVEITDEKGIVLKTLRFSLVN